MVASCSISKALGGGTILSDVEPGRPEEDGHPTDRDKERIRAECAPHSVALQALKKTAGICSAQAGGPRFHGSRGLLPILVRARDQGSEDYRVHLALLSPHILFLVSDCRSLNQGHSDCGRSQDDHDGCAVRAPFAGCSSRCIGAHGGALSKNSATCT